MVVMATSGEVRLRIAPSCLHGHSAAAGASCPHCARDSRWRTSVCPTDAPRSGSCEPWIVPVRFAGPGDCGFGRLQYKEDRATPREMEGRTGWPADSTSEPPRSTGCGYACGNKRLRIDGTEAGAADRVTSNGRSRDRRELVNSHAPDIVVPCPSAVSSA